jgi:hypothetical protein
MKAYKFELLVLDHENIGIDEMKETIEATRYVYPKVMDIQEADIGEWDDKHPLNKKNTVKQEYDRLFRKAKGW